MVGCLVGDNRVAVRVFEEVRPNETGHDKSSRRSVDSLYQHAYTNSMPDPTRYTGYLLKRVQASLRHAMDEALDAHGLSMAQYALLSNLDHEVGLTNAELARRSFVTPQTTIRILKDLERAGLVVRSTDPNNRRQLRASLTRVGRRRLRSADATALEVEGRMLDGFSNAEISGFRSLLVRASANLE